MYVHRLLPVKIRSWITFLSKWVTITRVPFTIPSLVDRVRSTITIVPSVSLSSCGGYPLESSWWIDSIGKSNDSSVSTSLTLNNCVCLLREHPRLSDYWYPLLLNLYDKELNVWSMLRRSYQLTFQRK